MRPAIQTASACLAVATALLATTPAKSADLAALPALNAPIGESSVSGLSSGAFMAAQLGTAWSSIIRGVGIVAGGPPDCAQGSFSNTDACMTGPPTALRILIAAIDAKAKAGAIDPTANLAHQRVYVFHGQQDDTVVRAVTDETVAFYTHYLGDAATTQLLYDTTIGAGHAFVVPDRPDTASLNDCPVTKPPYVSRCGDYDQAGVILRHIYGALAPPAKPNALSGTVKSFDQSRYAAPRSTDDVSLAPSGYVFVPKDCEGAAAAPCRVHVVLHGCRQNSGVAGRTVVDRAGFNGWADTNRIVVLYPQTSPLFPVIPFLPDNQLACWDWWGYLPDDAGYFTKSGAQIKAIKAMLDDLTAGYHPAAPAGAR
jgi:poly(3-hydroxybutyrate) depolymerase